VRDKSAVGACSTSKRKEKTTLAVTATVSDSAAGISLEEAEEVQAFCLLLL